MILPNEATPHNQLPPRSQIIIRSALILALSTLVTLITIGIYRMVYGDVFVSPLRPGPIPPWLSTFLPFLGANAVAMVLSRRGQTTVSAMVLIIFWTFSMTSVIMRFGAHTFFPAMLVFPSSASSLLFSRRTILQYVVNWYLLRTRSRTVYSPKKYNRAIALALHVSENTIKTYISHILPSLTVKAVPKPSLFTCNEVWHRRRPNQSHKLSHTRCRLVVQ